MGVQEKDVKKQEEGLIDITEMLNDYIRILKRIWLWILILAVVGTSVCYIRARRQYVPVYTASATFTINIQSEQVSGDGTTSSFFDNKTAQQMATSFPYILTSGVLKRKVSADLGGEGVASTIQASVMENTNLLTISVTDRDPDMAYKVLQSVIENYPSVSEVIVGKVYMEMLDETGVPVSPDNAPQYKDEAVKGLLIGLAAGLLWAGFLVLTRRTVCRESDINRYLNTRSLGTLPQITFKRRSNDAVPRLVVTDPKIEDVFQEPLRIIRNKVELNASGAHIKTLVITSALAGEGKSTVAVNLALSLAQIGKRVVLADCDLRNPSDRELLGLEEGEGLRDVLEGRKEFADCMMSAKELGLDPGLNLRFVPGGKAMSDGSKLLGSQQMKMLINKMEKWADYVILDTAPAEIGRAHV